MLVCRSSPGISLCQVVCGWYINQSVHNFVENNQLQFASYFMRLPAEIVKHVLDAAGVSVSVCDKSCRSSLDHFNLVFLVTLVWTPDCRTVVQVGSYHDEISLCLGFFACLSYIASQET